MSTTSRPTSKQPLKPLQSLFHQIRGSHPTLRTTIYAAFALAVAAESSCWYILLSTYFPSRAQTTAQQAASQQTKRDIRAAVRGYRAVYLGNYEKYYGAGMWGL